MKKAMSKEFETQNLYLLTIKNCQAAIHLYEKSGFVHSADVKNEFGSMYERCNVAMKYVR